MDKLVSMIVGFVLAIVMWKMLQCPCVVIENGGEKFN